MNIRKLVTNSVTQLALSRVGDANRIASIVFVFSCCSFFAGNPIAYVYILEVYLLPVTWSLCHNFLKGQEVTLPYSYRFIVVENYIHIVGR